MEIICVIRYSERMKKSSVAITTQTITKYIISILVQTGTQPAFDPLVRPFPKQLLRFILRHYNIIWEILLSLFHNITNHPLLLSPPSSGAFPAGISSAPVTAGMLFAGTV